MNKTVIHDTENFVLTSHGNGLAYDLHDKHTGTSVFVQGDDASQFMDELNAYVTIAPVLAYDDALTCMWAMYGGDDL